MLYSLSYIPAVCMHEAINRLVQDLAIREILLARIRNPIDVILSRGFLQACLKEKVPGNIKNTTEITGEHHVSHVEKGFLFR